MAKKRVRKAGPNPLGKRWLMSYKVPSPMTSLIGPGKLLHFFPQHPLFWRNRPAKLKSTNSFRSGEKITVTPSSKELLFYPPSMEATISGGTYLLQRECHACAVASSLALRNGSVWV
jgi:hypothetical protein